MPRGRKKQENVSLEERLADVTAQIERTEDTLKDLRRQRKEIEKLLEEQKKEQLYKAVVDSGKTIEEILEVLGRMDTDTKEQKQNENAYRQRVMVISIFFVILESRCDYFIQEPLVQTEAMPARTEGMGSGIPIKFAGEVKTTKWVLSYAGETCS